MNTIHIDATNLDEPGTCSRIIEAVTGRHTVYVLSDNATQMVDAMQLVTECAQSQRESRALIELVGSGWRDVPRPGRPDQTCTAFDIAVTFAPHPDDEHPRRNDLEASVRSVLDEVRATRAEIAPAVQGASTGPTARHLQLVHSAAA